MVAVRLRYHFVAETILASLGQLRGAGARVGVLDLKTEVAELLPRNCVVVLRPQVCGWEYKSRNGTVRPCSGVVAETFLSLSGPAAESGWT